MTGAKQTAAALAEQRRAARRLSTARKPWRDTIARLEAFAAQEGLTFELRNPQWPEYQIGRLTGEGVRLVVYPHVTTNGTNQARVRNENSADKVRAAAVAERLGFRVNNGAIR